MGPSEYDKDMHLLITKLRLKSEIPDSPKLGYEVHQVGILQLLIGAGWEGRERDLAQLS